MENKNRLVLVLVAIAAVGILSYTLWRGAPSQEPVPSTQSKMTYSADGLGISLLYPDTYTYVVGADTYASSSARIITFMDKTLAANIPENSEAPPGITLIVIDNPEGKNLESWVRNETVSNFGLSSDKKLTATTIGGELAFSYAFSGLYENDAYAVAHGDKVYFFFGGWISQSDSLRADLQEMVGSVHFI